MNDNILWKPQDGPQKEFLSLSQFEVGYGGAKGGGKTDALLFGALRQINNPQYRSIIFRRTFPQLKEIIDRSHIFKYIQGNPGSFNESEHRWTFKSGAILDFGHCQHEEDKENYQGQEYHYMGFDQLEQFTESQYTFLIGNIRTTKPGIKLMVRSGFNPGGVGHVWVKKRFVENKEPFKTYIQKYTLFNLKGEPVNVEYDSVFVPAKVWDNKILLETNRNYLATLMQMSEEKRKALLEGNWDIFEGQFFSEWNPTVHVVNPFTIPDSWSKIRSIDPSGRNGYTACGWYAIDNDGNVYKYREYYQTGKDSDEHAKEIVNLSNEEGYRYTVIDSSAFSKLGFPETQSEVYERNRVIGLVPASKSRVHGWDLLHQYLRIKNNESKLRIFTNCRNTIRTLPMLIINEHNPDDLDTSGEDHCADEMRYAIQTLRGQYSPKEPDTMSIAEIRLKEYIRTRQPSIANGLANFNYRK